MEELMLLNCGAREDFWESLGLQGDQIVNPKGNQPWILIERSDAEVEAPMICLSDVKSWLIGKDPDTGKDCRWEKEMTEDEMVACHHWLNELEFVQASGVGDGQGGLVCRSTLGRKELDKTEWLKWTDWPIGTSESLLKNLFIGG